MSQSLDVGAADVPFEPGEGAEVRRPTDLRADLRRPRGLRLVQRYHTSTWHVHDLERVTRPFLTHAMLRVLTRRQAVIEDLSGHRDRVTWATVLKAGARAVADRFHERGMLADLALLQAEANGGQRPDHASLDGPPLYIWADIVAGLVAGGAVTHTAGVLNNLGRSLDPPVFVSTQHMPLVRGDIECHVVSVPTRHWDRSELVPIAFNRMLIDAIPAILGGRHPSLIYQRHARWTIAGLVTARRLGVPLVLEYNGSELWVAAHWGSPIHRHALASELELLAVRGADLVVVVSEPLKSELVERGVDAARILVNPNGVDTERFSPDVDGLAVRTRLGLTGHHVVGFIGTFGAWHGAEVMAHAAIDLLERRPELAATTTFLFIGDGPRRAATEAIVKSTRYRASFCFTGLVQQTEGPAHLAACDVLVAPHLPNTDGTPFFGSPTKLFEYMAAGRGIVASDLDQIGEVLDDGRTALLVPPGDVRRLADGIVRLVEDLDLRGRLGAAARNDAVSRHTWAAHTDRIVSALRAITS